MKKLISLAASFIILASSIALAAGEVVQGTIEGNSQQTGIEMMGNGSAELIQDMRSDPIAEARRAQETALAAKQKRQAEEQRRAEVPRQQELAKQRILGSLKEAEPVTELTFKMGDSEPSTGDHELKAK